MMSAAIEAPFTPRSSKISTYVSEFRKHTYLKGRYHNITYVAIPLALVGSSMLLIGSCHSTDAYQTEYDCGRGMVREEKVDMIKLIAVPNLQAIQMDLATRTYLQILGKWNLVNDGALNILYGS